MVINGEKAPAFSARTLELPPEQIDNTALIIENTRRLYSRNRSEIEQEISEAIKVPQNLQPKAQQQPQSQAQAKQWPIEAGAKAVEQVIPAPFGSAEQGSVDPDAPVKKKRKRTRKRKPAALQGE